MWDSFIYLDTVLNIVVIVTATIVVTVTPDQSISMPSTAHHRSTPYIPLLVGICVLLSLSEVYASSRSAEFRGMCNTAVAVAASPPRLY